MPIATDPNSEFALAVYASVRAIPAGCVASYGDIARQAGFPRHSRFVGRLMSRLPQDTQLPWWRVIRSDGRLALVGAAADRQTEKLVAEGVAVIAGRVNLARHRA